MLILMWRLLLKVPKSAGTFTSISTKEVTRQPLALGIVTIRTRLRPTAKESTSLHTKRTTESKVERFTTGRTTHSTWQSTCPTDRWSITGKVRSKKQPLDRRQIRTSLRGSL